jgi:hypothetical protein
MLKWILPCIALVSGVAAQEPVTPPAAATERAGSESFAPEFF